ncbi:MAG: hypothetical protein A2932_02100 [Candidatus Spechtbacteria bacterium RIFCSPLOWO2_01_FULL_46_10]|uniref:Fibronectin type-III domain-containing protein n=1 Tax=Candidatus Spechtbacteria bacterium RIFCSPLOWO2_01_FULL_46_10 TaxID=1802163 RepID=A0A1G2HFL6_9BACT|nr:MAG: hypothetical protein A2932_02100 [Candidatus Spechtbacteria bacterium RIFCSPLOWO2_01_FULL_46_10]
MKFHQLQTAFAILAFALVISGGLLIFNFSFSTPSAYGLSGILPRIVSQEEFDSLGETSPSLCGEPNLPAECANGANNSSPPEDGQGYEACGFGNAWSVYQLKCASQLTEIVASYFAEAYRVGDKCISGETGLRTGYTGGPNLYSSAPYKQCCVVNDSGNFTGADASCVLAPVQDLYNPAAEGECPSGTQGVSCGGAGESNCNSVCAVSRDGGPPPIETSPTDITSPNVVAEATPLSVAVGETIFVRVIGADIESDIARLWFSQDDGATWTYFNCTTGSVCSHTFTITKSSPDTYFFVGAATDTALNSSSGWSNEVTGFPREEEPAPGEPTCRAEGDWSARGSLPLSGSETITVIGNPGELKQYTISCEDPTTGDSASETVSVRIGGVPEEPVAPELEGVNFPPTAFNLQITLGNYCVAPAQIFFWSFLDVEDGSSQTAYELQVDNNPAYGSLEFNSGVITSSATTRLVTVSTAPGVNQLAFNTQYYWRVRVRDSQGEWSNYANGTVFTTPLHPYPQVNFSWSPSNPTEGEPAQFTDQTRFFGAPQAWSWSISGAQYTGGTSSSSQNPQVEFSGDGQKQAALAATDISLASDPNSGTGQCSTSKAVNIQERLPEFEEVPPTSFFLYDIVSSLKDLYAPSN